MKRQILLIDNLDSFTFNLVESFQRLGCAVRTMRNLIAASEALAIAEQSNALIVLSAGPGTPDDAGCCLELVGAAKGKVPLLGICLGHQAIAQQAGARISPANEPVHGKSSLLTHDGGGPFRGLEGPLRVGRYHSLSTREVPERFTVHAAIGGMAMAISDQTMLQTGLQFHPESILTTDGDKMLANILEDAFDAG